MPAKQETSGKLTNALRQAIKRSERSQADLAWSAGMNPSQMYRFMAGGTLTLATLDRLAELLGAELVFPIKGAKKPARASR